MFFAEKLDLLKTRAKVTFNIVLCQVKDKNNHVIYLVLVKNIKMDVAYLKTTY